RRMEVFAGLYTAAGEQLLPPGNLVLDETSFSEWLDKEPVLFFGNGSSKFASLTKHPNAQFRNVTASAKDLVPLALEAARDRRFADLAYSEPFYGKEFFSPHFSPSA
ncbi:MAG: tsaB, partial [Flaviaesturariibacter sp.]|nr:tsaB [Flaviaesturariibacter sp.]